MNAMRPGRILRTFTLTVKSKSNPNQKALKQSIRKIPSFFNTVHSAVLNISMNRVTCERNDEKLDYIFFLNFLMKV